MGNRRKPVSCANFLSDSGCFQSEIQAAAGWAQSVWDVLYRSSFHYVKDEYLYLAANRPFKNLEYRLRKGRLSAKTSHQLSISGIEFAFLRQSNRMDDTLIFLLIGFVLIDIQAYYFGFISPPPILAWLQQACFTVFTFLLIPLLIYVRYSQAGSVGRLEQHRIESYPAI